MKQIYSLFRPIALLAIIFSFYSCSEDENGPITNNSIKLNGNSFEVRAATLLGVSLNGEGHVALSLVSNEGVLVKTLNIDFEYATAEPVDGAYAYPESGEVRLINDWLTTYTILEGTSFESEHLEEGSMTLVHNGGDNYTVTMDLQMEGGSVFKGTYTGDFNVVFNNG